MTWLEKHFGLPDLPWEEGPTRPVPVDVRTSAPITPEDALKRLERALAIATQEGSLPVERLAAFWEVYDGLAYKMRDGADINGLPEQVLAKLTPPQ